MPKKKDDKLPEKLTAEELAARLEDLRAENAALPEAIKGNVREAGDGASLAALIARRSAMSVMLALAEAEYLEAEARELETDLSEAREKAAAAELKVKKATEAKRRAEKEQGAAYFEHSRSKSVAWKVKEKIDSLKVRAIVLRKEAEAQLERKGENLTRFAGWSRPPGQ